MKVQAFCYLVGVYSFVIILSYIPITMMVSPVPFGFSHMNVYWAHMVALVLYGTMWFFPIFETIWVILYEDSS